MAIITEIKDYTDDRGNQIVGAPKICTNSSIRFDARNCRVEIAEGVVLQRCNVVFSADGGVLKIGQRSTLKCAVRLGHNSTITVGERLSHTGGGSMSATEGQSIAIGDDCMFAVGLDIRADHSHPIFCRRTGRRLNRSKSLTIGNHVWLGPQAYVYPGAQIGEGSVIGARSLVNGTIPPNCVALGTPARVTRRNIVWDKRHIGKPSRNGFESIDDIPRPWESAFPIEEETNWWSRMKAAVFTLFVWQPIMPTALLLLER